MKRQLIDFLAQNATENRNELFKKVLADRTNYISVVLENIYQPQNASAVLRSCDCFGVQNVHIIENSNQFEVNPDIALGSSKWLSINKYNEQEENTFNCLSKLKKKGYRIIATTPHSNDVNLEAFDLTAGKSALVFGTELTGISKVVEENADEFMKIPMYGFTESFNISVSVAITLHHLTYKLREQNINWQLSPDERDDVMLQWLRKSIKSSEKLERKFRATFRE